MKQLLQLYFGLGMIPMVWAGPPSLAVEAVSNRVASGTL